MMKKRICSLITAVALCFTMFVVPAFAADPALTANAAYDNAKKTVTVTGTTTSTRQVTAYIYAETDTTVAPLDSKYTSPSNGAYTIVIDMSAAKYTAAQYTVIVAQGTVKTDPVTFTAQDAKTTAGADINTAFAAYKQADYSEANYAALTAIKDKAIVDINATTTVDAIAPIVTKAKADMAAVKTAIVEAKETAVNDVTTAYATYKAADYTADNFTALTVVKDKAVADINAATTVDAIAPIAAKAKTDMAAVKTIAQTNADKNAAIGSVKIAGATVGTLPACATESAYAPFVNVTLDTTVAAIKASDFAAADNGTVKLYTDSAYANEVTADGFTVAANNFKLYAKVISADGTATKYLNFNFNVVDAAAQYKISAPDAFTKVGSKYEATVSVDRDKAAKLDDARLYVVFTAADGITQQYMTMKLDPSDTTASLKIAISAGYKSVNAYVVNGDVDWSTGDPIAKSDFVTINVQ